MASVELFVGQVDLDSKRLMKPQADITRCKDKQAVVERLMLKIEKQCGDVWTAVNRISRSGKVIGPHRRITAMEAWKAITINAAHQHSEEKSKGALESGKLAGLVTLDKNPLQVDPMSIKDSKVVETIEEGKTIYKANRARTSFRKRYILFVNS